MTFQDDYGIVTRNAEMRAAYGDRRSHGYTRDLGLPPVVVVPSFRPPVVRRLEPPAPPKPEPVALPRHAPVARSVSVSDVLAAVLAEWPVSREGLLGRHLDRHKSHPRMAAYLLMRRHMQLSLPAIARAMCRKDHTTIKKGLWRAAILLEKDADWRERYERAEARLMGDGQC